MDQLPFVLLAQVGEDVAPPPVLDAPAGPAGGDGTTTQAPGNGTGGQTTAAPTGGPFDSLLFILLPIFAIMLIFTMTSSRKEKKKRQAIIDNLRKGAKVRTVGGILGTVVEVRDDEVVVKVDENANTRLRFAKAAIQDVTHDEKKDEKPAK